MTTHPSPPINDYATIFDQYIVRTLQAIKAASQEEGDTLSAATRQRALRALDFALDSHAAQPVTGELLIELAPKMEKAGLRDEWIAHLKRGLNITEQSKDHYTEGQIAFQLGQLYQLLSKFDLATDYFNQSIALFSNMHRQKELAMALNRLAYVATLQGNVRYARDLVERASSLISENDQEMAYCLFVLGMAAKVDEDWTTAEFHLTRSLEFRQSGGTTREIALALMNLGMIYRSSKQFKKAQQCYYDANILFQELDDSLYIATCHMNLGNIFLSQNMFANAIECYTLAEPIFRKLHHELRLAYVYNNIGLAYAGLSDWEKAETALQSSTNRLRILGSVAEEVETLCDLTELYINKSELQRAQNTIYQARQKLQTLAEGNAKRRLTTWLDKLASKSKLQR